MSVKKPIEILKINLEEAIKALAQKFEIANDELKKYGFPFIRIVEDKKAGYKPQEKEIFFGIGLIEDIPALGEEASHFLHSELNPFYKRRFTCEELLAVDNLSELVGCYGKIIYANEKGVKVPTARELWPSDSIPPPEHLGEYFKSHWTHYKGYKRAEQIFIKYGESKLAKIARMSPEEASTVLPRCIPISFYEKRILPVIDRIKGCKQITL